MKKIEEQDEIMNKIQRKIDKDIERMKTKKDMDKSVEKQIRKQLLKLYLFQSENEVKTEKQRKQNKTQTLQKNVGKNAKNKQKTDEKQQKNSKILSKNSTQYNISVEQEQAKDYYSLTKWKSISQELRKEHPECQLCGKRKSEEVHHIFPFMHQFEDIREEVFLDKDNLICLCSDCHHQVHAKNYGNLGIPERTKIENLRSQISRKYLNQGKILSWL